VPIGPAPQGRSRGCFRGGRRSAGRRVDADRFPLTQQAGAIQFGDFDERFDQGVRIIVAGLERLREHST
jgi:hypothetical protein